MSFSTMVVLSHGIGLAIVLGLWLCDYLGIVG